MKLYEHQEKCLTLLKDAFKKYKRVCFQLPTGGGKTVVLAEMARRVRLKGHKVLFLVDRKELVKQTIVKLQEQKVSLSDGGTIVSTVQGYVRRLDFNPDFIVIDECHGARSSSYTKVLERHTNSWVIGLTATPERLDGKGLSEVFQTLVKGPDINWHIKKGFLTPPKVYAPDVVDLSGVNSTAGDYNLGALYQAVKRADITGNIVEHYKRLALGKKAIVFAINIEHSKEICKAFNDAGIPAIHADGTDGDIEAFRTGEADVLCNCMLATTGVDVPDIKVVIMARPTQSRVLYNQMVGRGLRKFPGKTETIIIDHANNTLTHNPVTWPVEWNFFGSQSKKKKLKGKTINLRTCPKCFIVHETAPECPECGHVYETKKRTITVTDGDLKLIDVSSPKFVKPKPIKSLFQGCRTIEEFKNVAERAGLKPGAGYFQYKWRKEKGII